jgi:hypothetical protein
MSEPRASRPRFPQGYEVPTDKTGLLPWSHARARLEQAQNLLGLHGDHGRQAARCPAVGSLGRRPALLRGQPGHPIN